ncbi:MAG: hypothetical protein P9L99_10945 [Candidatus Lernaella stagnicola]|nr:hypothetical protein [Candidatus Lernaella stagnicola]
MKRWLVVLAVLAFVAGCGGEDAGLTFDVGVEGTFYPWSGTVRLDSLAIEPGAEWVADFDLSADLRRLKDFREYVESVAVVIVGEPVFDAAGTPVGLTATAVSSVFTTAGIPLSYYEGTLPVRAFGNRRGSPFEGVMEFPAATGRTRLRGRMSVPLPADIAPGYYRPHVEIFVRLRGADAPIDVGHLPFQLNQWLDNNADVAGAAGGWMKLLGERPDEPYEFMYDPQVLPEIKVGSPQAPHAAWTIFHDVDAYGQSGLLPREDAARLGLLNRVRFPTPYLLRPGRYRVNPGLPTLFPESGLADLFIGDDTVPTMIRNYLDFQRGEASAVLTGPDGRRVDLGTRAFAGRNDAGPLLAGGGFDVSLGRTGRYRLELTGTMVDLFGRAYEGGGTYEFTVALPLTFSTPVKPGTNYLTGSRYPAAAKVNPPVPADVTIEVDFFPNSDPARARHATFTGRANQFGHFAAAGTPMVFDEPGEYRSLLTTRFVDPAGNLWYGAQTSAGVVAPRDKADSEVCLHGGRTYLAPPDPAKPHYGGLERFAQGTEGGSSVFEPETLCQYDYIFPYHSGDTLFVSTTYPFETVVGIVLSMEAKTRELAERLVDAYNPDGRQSLFPITPKHRRPIFLPDVFKFSEDNFGYYRMSVEGADHLPILWANGRGLSPFLYREDNEIEAYTYLSVIRPGFPVLSLAFAGSFQGPCWIVSPNTYGGQINAGPNGDLPGDLYRIMAGLVVKDKKTGRNYYDAYAATVVATPPGTWNNAVAAPGEQTIYWQNGREQYFFIGLDTSDSFTVGEKMLVAGTVMPPVEADVHFTITKPDGAIEELAGRSNRLGGFLPSRAIDIEQPGVYRVKAHIERQGAGGDVAGTGDGEFHHFAIPADAKPFLDIDLPFSSGVAPGGAAMVPLRWPTDLEAVKLHWSIMMPGAVIDEGSRAIDGDGYSFRIVPRELAAQYPYIDVAHYGDGRSIAVDTIVVVLLLEAERGGQKVWDMARIILRGTSLYNMRAVTQGDGAMPHAPGGMPHGAPHPSK